MESIKERIPRIRNFDPLADWLHKRMGPIGFGLIFFLANVIVEVYLGFRYDVFLTVPVEGQPPPPPGILQNWTALVVDFISEPVIGGIYLWTTIGATRLFRQLQASGVFASENVVAEKVDKSRPLFAKRLVFHLIWIVSLIYTFSQVAAYMGWVPWKSAGGYLELHPVSSFYRAPFWFLNFYTLAFAAFNVAVTVRVLRDLFRTQQVELVVLHPDRCGGLSSISRFSVMVAWAIAVNGLVLSVATVYEIRRGSLANAYPILVGIFAYILLAPLFFFWPFGTAHEAMREAKEKTLLDLARRYDTIYSDLKRRVGQKQQKKEEQVDVTDIVEEEQGKGINGVEADMRQLDQLQKLYEIAEKFPVWPFNVENLRRFFTVVTAPLLPAFISITIELLTPVFINLFTSGNGTP